MTSDKPELSHEDWPPEIRDTIRMAMQTILPIG
jgi:hypothetical protein